MNRHDEQHERRRNTLAEYHLQRTKERVELLACFEEPRTWTHAQLCRVLPTADPSTITRNLQTFERAGIIQRAHVHGTAQHFEQKKTTHHDHKICKTCDISECVPCPSPKLPRHHIELIGFCRHHQTSV